MHEVLMPELWQVVLTLCELAQPVMMALQKVHAKTVHKQHEVQVGTGPNWLDTLYCSNTYLARPAQPV